MSRCYIASAHLPNGRPLTKVGISFNPRARAKRFGKYYGLNVDFNIVRTFDLPTRRGASGMEQTLHLMLRDWESIGQELFFVDAETVCEMAEQYLELVKL